MRDQLVDQRAELPQIHLRVCILVELAVWARIRQDDLLLRPDRPPGEQDVCELKIAMRPATRAFQGQQTSDDRFDHAVQTGRAEVYTPIDQLLGGQIVDVRDVERALR